ncbi:MAG TPA: hypothetical protein VMW26_06025 [Methanomassiliicoccales archaeon]|nr:hypothetical protein [Methanomassiliicoccales archaeon]
MLEGLRESTESEILVLKYPTRHDGHLIAFESGEIAKAMRRNGFSEIMSRPE